MSSQRTTQPSDYSERQRALDIQGSFIVEAPAGSGKTGLLMQRYLRLLAASDIEAPEQVLAITFTRKAAAEMRERIVTALDDAANKVAFDDSSEFAAKTRELAEQVLQRSNLVGWNLLQQSQRLNITTIDALCAQISRRLPILAGGGNLQPVTDPAPLYAEAAQRTLRQLGSGNQDLDESLRTLILHREGRLHECADLIAKMLQWRDQWLRHVPHGIEQIQQWRDSIEYELQKIILQHLQLLVDNLSPALLCEISELAHIAAKNLKLSEKYVKHPVWLQDQRVPAVDIASLPKWLGIENMLLTGSGSWRKRFTTSEGMPTKSAEKQRMEQLLQTLSVNDALRIKLAGLHTLPPTGYEESQWQMARALFQVLPRACAELNVLFVERSQCDFTAISGAAVMALQNEHGCSELALAMGTRIQHLLVDEMQDTSVTHYELLKAITASWDGFSQTVFLVGDPKQSIYLFREARVELFMNAMKYGLGELQLEPVRLTANFRSQANLVKAFNKDFTKIFQNHDVAAIANKDANTGTRAWHIAVAAHNDKAVRHECETRQAEEIAQRVNDQRNGSNNNRRDKSKPSIAILVRNRSHALPILTELRRLGIPYSAVEMEELSEQPEIQDLLALTRALIHAGDRVAWLSVLRAPWCGLTLQSLLQLVSSANSTAPMHQLIRENMQSLSASEHERMLRTWNVLEPAVRLANRIPLSELVERTWISLGGPGLAAGYSRTDKSVEDVLENVECYLSLLDTIAAEHSGVDAGLIESRLSNLKANSMQQSAAVEILTIHKSKGLEWDTVYLPALHRVGARDDKQLLEWYEVASLDGDMQGTPIALLAPVPSRSAEKSSEIHRMTDWVRRYKQQRKYEELKRLFYVACTRARNQLHLFAVTDDRDEYRPRKDSLLHAAWTAFDDEHADTHAHPASTTSDNSAIDTIAAAEEPMTLQRIRDGVNPLEEFQHAIGNNGNASLLYTARESLPGGVAKPARPESSLSARAFGNVVHHWLQRLSESFSAGCSPEDSEKLIQNATAIITAQLRHEGVPANDLRSMAERVTLALQNTLQDPSGHWVLASTNNSASEYARSLLRENRAIQLRMDRIFKAGAEPLSTEDDYLWIIDYKTSDPGSRSVDEFLAEEREVYRRQLEGYAEAIRLQYGSTQPVRVALYYPLLPKLDWWSV